MSAEQDSTGLGGAIATVMGVFRLHLLGTGKVLSAVILKATSAIPDPAIAIA
ncbi:MAG: hypothetical protein WBA10_16035 [Elainellaceae cyanobacterium]